MESSGKNLPHKSEVSDELGRLSERIPTQMAEIINRKRLETKEVVSNPVLLPSSGVDENTLFSIPGTDGIRRIIAVRESLEQKDVYIVGVEAFVPPGEGASSKGFGPRKDLDRLQENVGSIQADSRNAFIREVLDQAYNKVKSWSPTPARTRK